MTWGMLQFLLADAEPQVKRLRRISTVFFFLWVFDLLLNVFCDCMIFKVNLYVVLNVWVVLAAAAFSHYQSFQYVALYNMKTEKELLSLSVDTVAECTDMQDCNTADATTGAFRSGSGRFYALASFGSALFVMFGCLCVIGDGLQHNLHTPGTCRVLFLATGLLHVVLFTVYVDEIEMYDHITGRGCGHVAADVFPSMGLFFMSWRYGRSLLNRWKCSLLYQRVIRGLFCALVPFVSMAFYLVSVNWGCFFCEFSGMILLAGYVFVLALNRAMRLVPLLANNAVREPTVVAKCDSAVCDVKLLEGVLQVLSSVFWEVTEGELMALVRLRLMPLADFSTVTLEARKILAKVATYVFVEVCTTECQEHFSFTDCQGEEEKRDPFGCQSHDHHHDHYHPHHH